MGGTEIELKLLLDDAALRRVRRLPWLRRLALDKPTVRTLRSTYFDTPDGELRRRGISLRVRTVGRRHMQGVKSAAVPGMLSRREWEWPIERPEPELAGLPADLARHFRGITERRLEPLFRTEIRRTTLRVRGDDWRADLALDVGELVAAGNGARRPLRELEIELVDGPPARVYELALRLADSVPLRVGAASKSDRGYALVGKEAPEPRKWRAPALDQRASAADALRALAGACVEQFLVNADCLLATGDPEAVHQMRVALRRLRSAISVFRGYVAPEGTAAVAAEVKWLLGELGPARDTDVFLAEVLAPVVEGMPGQGALGRLTREFGALKERRYDAARLAVESQRCTKLALAIGAWIEDGWRVDDRLAALPAGDFAAQVLERRDRKMRKAGPHLAELGVEERHRLRIRIKKLRYAGEFFASLFPEGRARRFLAGLAVLQDRLGALNDLAVASHMLEITEDTDPQRAWEAGIVAGWHASRAPRLLAEAGKAWKAFADLPRFWR